MSARDLIGYGSKIPQVRWPGDAHVAVNLVVNYEEGSEYSYAAGDAENETLLGDSGYRFPADRRDLAQESMYEYGSRVGVWRLLDLFRNRQIPITVFAVAMALDRNPLVADVALADGHEICSHGYRWINYQWVPEEVEREHLYKAIEIIRRITGERPLGWYTGRTSPNTRRLVAEEGGFLYDADDYSDDLPFWSRVVDRPHLIVPYSLDANDMRFATAQGFNSGDQFHAYLRDAFDVLYAEGETTPRMMSVGLHCRLVGRPGRIRALEKFIDYAQSHDRVWFCRRIDIARHWRRHHPPTAEPSSG
jgi:putative urate catabolism protein